MKGFLFFLCILISISCLKNSSSFEQDIHFNSKNDSLIRFTKRKQVKELSHYPLKTLPIQATKDSISFGMWFSDKRNSNYYDIHLFYSKDYLIYEVDYRFKMDKYGINFTDTFNFMDSKFRYKIEIKKDQHFLNNSGYVYCISAYDSSLLFMDYEKNNYSDILYIYPKINYIQQPFDDLKKEEAEYQAYIDSCKKRDNLTIGRFRRRLEHFYGNSYYWLQRKPNSKELMFTFCTDDGDYKNYEIIPLKNKPIKELPDGQYYKTKPFNFVYFKFNEDTTELRAYSGIELKHKPYDIEKFMFYQKLENYDYDNRIDDILFYEKYDYSNYLNIALATLDANISTLEIKPHQDKTLIATWLRKEKLKYSILNLTFVYELYSENNKFMLKIYKVNYYFKELLPYKEIPLSNPEQFHSEYFFKSPKEKELTSISLFSSYDNCLYYALSAEDSSLNILKKGYIEFSMKKIKNKNQPLEEQQNYLNVCRKNDSLTVLRFSYKEDPEQRTKDGKKSFYPPPSVYNKIVICRNLFGKNKYYMYELNDLIMLADPDMVEYFYEEIYELQRSKDLDENEFYIRKLNGTYGDKPIKISPDSSYLFIPRWNKALDKKIYRDKNYKYLSKADSILYWNDGK